jgi:hypothetical protein
MQKPLRAHPDQVAIERIVPATDCILTYFSSSPAISTEKYAGKRARRIRQGYGHHDVPGVQETNQILP